jgi:hypothetical protein
MFLGMAYGQNVALTTLGRRQSPNKNVTDITVRWIYSRVGSIALDLMRARESAG